EQAKTEAVNAKDQANAAKTQAEGARDKALEAQGKAEAAKSEAEKILSKTEDIAANNPFEYYTKDNGDSKGVKVVKGRDGNLYKEDELANYQYDKTQKKYVAKDPSTKEELKSLEAKDVLIKAVPNTIPMEITNVESGLEMTTPMNNQKEELKKLADTIKEKVTELGEKTKDFSDTETKLADLELMVSSLKRTVDTMPDGEAKDKMREELKKYEPQLSAAQEAKENAKKALTEARQALVDANKDYKDKYNELTKAADKVADLVKPDSKAQLTNVANIGDLQAVARAGLNFEGNDGKRVHKDLSETLAIKGEENASGDKFNSNHTAAGNIKVEMAQDGNGLEVKLSDQLKNMTSFETSEINGKKSVLNNGGLTVTGSGDHAGQSASYTLDGVAITGKNGSVQLNTTALSFAVTQDPSGRSVGTGVIRGLKDLDAQATGDMAVNKNYVDALQTQTDQKFNHLEHKFEMSNKELRAGVAQAVAQANLPVNILPGKSTLSLATGNYMGTQAFAVGYSRVSDNGKLSVKFSLGHGDKKTSVGAGIGYSW
ncbi:YadA C-terminal domain-containing protein, partial [Histophilus somni]|uniref:YadA C-terminal domain-containing protein n=1 Tax=Histophilus somni TaxID=731 RepID=UPI00201F5EDA